MLIDPTEEIQANYTVLVNVEEEIINKLQHGESNGRIFKKKSVNEEKMLKSQQSCEI